MKKRTKEYNARGERMYKNSINRENAKIEKINENKMKKITYFEFKTQKNIKYLKNIAWCFLPLGDVHFFDILWMME